MEGRPCEPGKDAKFKWPKVTNDEGIEETLQERLYRITDNHCAYCDNTVQPASNVTIDHFKEKVGHEDDAYVWENLYACCGVCQARGKWHEDMLRPDAEDYSFHRYFRYSHDGWLKVAPQQDTDEGKEALQKAAKTEEVLKLNRQKLRDERAEEFRRHVKPRSYPLPKPCDAATAARIMARREEQRQDVTRLRYRDWYLTFPGTICRCTGCTSRG